MSWILRKKKPYYNFPVVLPRSLNVKDTTGQLISFDADAYTRPGGTRYIVTLATPTLTDNGQTVPVDFAITTFVFSDGQNTDVNNVFFSFNSNSRQFEALVIMERNFFFTTEPTDPPKTFSIDYEYGLQDGLRSNRATLEFNYRITAP